MSDRMIYKSGIIWRPNRLEVGMEQTSKDVVGIAMAERKWTKSLIEAVCDGVLIADALGNVCYVNGRYLKIADLEEADILGRPLSEVRPGSVLPKVIQSGEARMGFTGAKEHRNTLSICRPFDTKEKLSEEYP